MQSFPGRTVLQCARSDGFLTATRYDTIVNYGQILDLRPPCVIRLVSVHQRCDGRYMQIRRLIHKVPPHWINVAVVCKPES
jgi:hypothetical protein